MPTASETIPQAETMPLVRRWKTALSNAGMLQAEWSRKFGWTESHVSQVVADKRVSPPVMREVMAFIEEQERDIAARAPRDVARPAA